MEINMKALLSARRPYLKKLIQKDADSPLIMLHYLWQKDGDQILLPSVIELNGWLYWLPPGSILSLTGLPQYGNTFEQHQRLIIERELEAVLTKRAIRKMNSSLFYPWENYFKAAVHLTFEKKIVWLRDPAGFPYLRQDFKGFTRKDSDLRKEKLKSGELIGFAVLNENAKGFSGRYHRRYFWFKTDGKAPFEGGYPGEAVKVTSIKAGVPAEEGRDF